MSYACHAYESVDKRVCLKLCHGTRRKKNPCTNGLMNVECIYTYNIIYSYICKRIHTQVKGDGQHNLSELNNFQCLQGLHSFNVNHYFLVRNTGTTTYFFQYNIFFI